MGLWPDTLNAPDVVTWDGNRWRLHADGYYRYSKRGLLHRAIYEKAHGPLADGLHVHHDDHNPLNNDPSNLVAKTPAEHWAEHHDERGAAWHSKGGHATWANAEYREYICKQCGKPFSSRNQAGAEICSVRCRERWYTAHKIGRSWEDHVCVVCGTGFKRKVRVRPAPSATCSRPCTARYVADIKTGRRPRPDSPG